MLDFNVENHSALSKQSVGSTPEHSTQGPNAMAGTRHSMQFPCAQRPHSCGTVRSSASWLALLHRSANQRERHIDMGAV
eukprot:359359-Chlamydomonas_euryale.AAC.8